MRFYTYAALALLVAATGCSSKETSPENLVFGNDFDSLAGWIPENPSLTQEKAHSGKYSIKVQQGIEYSLTYINLLGKISPTKVSKLRISAYVYVTKPSAATLVLQVTRSATDPTSIFNQGINFKDAVKQPGKWVKVSQVFTLPADAAATNQLKVYVWNSQNDNGVYVDDLEVSKE
jgi:hypothetical protein